MFGNPYWTCQVLLVPFFGSSMSSTWLILAMTYERFYSIIRPHKAASFNTVKRANITIACILVLCMTFNVPRLFLSKMEGLQCLLYGQGSTFWSQVYFYTEMCTSFIFPFVYLLSINSVIIHTLRNRRKSESWTVSGSRSKWRSNKEDKNYWNPNHSNITCCNI